MLGGPLPTYDLKVRWHSPGVHCSGGPTPPRARAVARGAARRETAFTSGSTKSHSACGYLQSRQSINFMQHLSVCVCWQRKVRYPWNWAISSAACWPPPALFQVWLNIAVLLAVNVWLKMLLFIIIQLLTLCLCRIVRYRRYFLALPPLPTRISLTKRKAV